MKFWAQSYFCGSIGNHKHVFLINAKFPCFSFERTLLNYEVAKLIRTIQVSPTVWLQDFGPKFCWFKGVIRREVRRNVSLKMLNCENTISGWMYGCLPAVKLRKSGKYQGIGCHQEKIVHESGNSETVKQFSTTRGSTHGKVKHLIRFVKNVDS